MKRLTKLILCGITVILILCAAIAYYYFMRSKTQESFYNYPVESKELKLSDTSKKTLIVTCLYNIPGRHSTDEYKAYVANWLPYVDNAAILFYVDDYYHDYVKSLIPPAKLGKTILLIKLPIEEFKTYKLYEQGFKDNYDKMKAVFDNDYRKQIIWAEKINFMYEGYLLYPHADWIMWLDAGYFRDKENDPAIAKKFPQMHRVNKDKIYLVKIINEDQTQLYKDIANTRTDPTALLSDKNIEDQLGYGYLAAGFILCHKSNLYMLWSLFYTYLQKFMDEQRTFKDDQMILAHIVFDKKYEDKFVLLRAPDTYKKDLWFYAKDYLTE